MMHHRTKRMSKEKNQRYHAKVRMLQHYGKQITNYDLDRMAEIYRHSVDTVILVKQSNRIRKALIWYKGEAYPIVYDKLRNQIVTVLKEEYLSSKQRVIFEKFKFRMTNKMSEIHNPVLREDVDVSTREDAVEVVETNPTVEEFIEEEQEETEDEMNQRLMKEAFDRLLN